MAAVLPRPPVQDSTILTGPPWTNAEGIFNLRSLGGYPIQGVSTESTRPLWIYRSAEPSRITPKGIEELHRLGIKKMFDLRSEPELDKMAMLTPLIEIPGIERVFVPVFKKEDYSPEQIAIRYKAYRDGGVEGFTQAYRDILKASPNAYREIFNHIRDKPHEGAIIHCTAGKDRTGLVCAMILTLAGVDDDTVAEEYALTTKGLEPMRELILKHLSTEKALEGNVNAAENMLSSRKEAMSATLEIIRNEYDGVEGYLKNKCGFTDEDIDKMKANLVVNEPPYVKL